MMKTKCMIITEKGVQEFISMEEHKELMQARLTSTKLEKVQQDYSPGRDFYSVNDFIEKFQVTRPTMYEWIKKGIIEEVKVGGRKYIKGSSVRQLLEKISIKK